MDPKPPTPFSEPIFVSRPLLPDLARVNAKIAQIWSTQWLANMGPQHIELETRLRAFLKVPGLSLFNNGTTALIAACHVLQLRGQVITTPFTFPATVHALTLCGLTPVFCDIDPVTLNLDPNRLESLVEPATTSAILGVHVYGTPCPVADIADLAEKHRLKVIYDAAHAFGVEIAGQGIGSFGDLTMFSFHATKMFHTAEGGALTYRDPALQVAVNNFRNFGIRNEEEVSGIGLNGKMNELQAAIGLLTLDDWPEEWTRRQLIRQHYSARLGEVPGLTLPTNQPNTTVSQQYFVIRVDEKEFGCSRDELHRRLKEYNIITRKYFYPLCSQYDTYRHLPSADPARLPVATAVASQVLCLPFYGGLTGAQVETICDAILACRAATSTSWKGTDTKNAS